MDEGVYWVIRWQLGIVESGVELRKGLQQLEVRMPSGAVERALHYTDVHAPAAAGDRVLLNTTAVTLGLGTGGFHFVYAVYASDSDFPAAGLTKPEDSDAEAAAGHIMKLRYTPLQRTVLAAEEQGSPYYRLFGEDLRLDGLPVLIGELHSMLPIAACWLHYAGGSANPPREPGTVYVMTDGGALPLAFSKHADTLKRGGLIKGTVTYGSAYGGDLETVNKFTGLLAAKHILRCDVCIVTMGPGIVGTGTKLGHTGVEVAELVNAAAALGGVPIVMPRISFADGRGRHQGISHHTLSALSELALGQAVIPLPAQLSALQRDVLEKQIKQSGLAQKHTIVWQGKVGKEAVREALRIYPMEVTTMRRGMDEDEAYFLGIACAAQEAVHRLAANGRSGNA